jgi:hypothetical protein
MIRVIIFLVAVAVLAAFAVWIANNPGMIVIEWPLLHRNPVEVDIGLVVVALVVCAAAVIALYEIARRIILFPEFLSLFMRRRRIARGYLAITRGLIAVGAGDPYAARRFAREANRIAADEPLAMLLAKKPSSSACTACSWRRSGARMRRRRVCLRKKRRNPRLRSPGQDRPCSNSAAPAATGSVRSRRSIAICAMISSTARPTVASGRCC